MHYHVRLDKVGCADDGQSFGFERKDFRSLEALLGWAQKTYGDGADGWSVMGMDGLYDRATKLVNALRSLLMTDHQYLYMGLSAKSPDYGKCESYCFNLFQNEGEPEGGFSFPEPEEAAITENPAIFKPDFRQSIFDIVKSFDMTIKSDVESKAFASIYEFYGDEEDVPGDIRDLKSKRVLSAADYCSLGDECQSCGEEQYAAVLYAKAVAADGEDAKRGKALTDLADLYMNSDWPKNGGREWDVMKAVDLLSEALMRGCVQEAKDVLEGMRDQLFDEWIDEQPDVDYFIRNYQADALCLAAFCLAVGIGWKKDVRSATILYSAALSRGYDRATYYLDEIRRGRV